MMTSRSLICLLENQNGGKLQKISFPILFHARFFQKFVKKRLLVTFISLVSLKFLQSSLTHL
jgi:hypothetical protein